MLRRTSDARGWAVLAGFAVVLLAPALVRSQGVLVVVDPDQQVRLPRPIYRPRPPQPQPTSQYEISALDVAATIKDQVAQVQVAQEFHNTASTALEVSFMFPLPYDGAIVRLTLMVDGKELPGKLLSADEARSRYEAIVRKNRDPALLEWVGHGMFQTNVFPVPAGAKRKVTLRYTQLCRADRGVTDFLFPLSTARYTAGPVGSVDVRVTLQSNVDVKNVYSPSHDVKIERDDPRHVTVTYHAERTVPTTDFRLLYDVGDDTLATRLLSYRPERSGSDGDDNDGDGYFLLLANPPIAERDDSQPLPKTVVFVVDRSGSMSGKKIEQAREALTFVLDNLREGDLFNIVAYDTEVTQFKSELQKYNDETRAEAVGFVRGINAGGSTNIDGALKLAMGQLTDSSRPNYLIFLTDGLPTAGETNESKIVAGATAANQVRARIFSFGVGYDVNSRLLDRLTSTNRGQSEYVQPDDNIEDRVARLYNRISSPVLSDVAVTFEMNGRGPADGPLTDRVYPKHDFDLFAGEQLVVVGRYRQSGDVAITVTGSNRGETETHHYEATLAAAGGDQTYAFIERLWAARRIGEIIDEIDLNGENQELVDEMVRLSTRHGILTPYTSFLADETTDLRALTRNSERAEESLQLLKDVSGRSAFYQREGKQMLRNSAQANTPSYGAGGYGGGGFGSGGYGANANGAPVPTSRLAGGGGFAGDRQGGPPTPALLSGRAASSVGGTPGNTADAPNGDGAFGSAVQNIGNRTFYRRGERWVDASVSDDEEQKLIRVTQFSDDYFRLVEKLGDAITPYLVFDEAVLVKIAGQAYLIAPEKE
ncbi:MAG: VWA domain-containing protein [Planctomycetales bacterium]|nr:VWA domain-containing protein [Planctomycetales bacterium]